MNIDIIQRQLVENYIGGKFTELQEQWWEEYLSDSLIVHLKGPRGSGRTLFGVGLLASESFLYSNRYSVICTDNQDSRRFRMNQAKEFIEQSVSSLSKFVNCLFEYPFKNVASSEILLDNCSVITCLVRDYRNFRGRTLSGLFIDETGIKAIEDINEEFWAAVMPMMLVNHDNKSKIIISMDE